MDNVTQLEKKVINFNKKKDGIKYYDLLINPNYFAKKNFQNYLYATFLLCH